MKYNILFICAIFQFLVFQGVFAQTNSITSDENGRPLGSSTSVTEAPESTSTLDPNTEWDMDMPEYLRKSFEEEETAHATQSGEQALNSSSALRNILNKLDRLEEKVVSLEQENQNLKRSLLSCCANGESLGSSAYLVQNAPNPFLDKTNIEFFVPENAENALIEIRDVKGTILDSYEINQKGIGQIQVEKTSFATGSYIYNLVIDNVIIDSKVMIVTK